MELITVDHTSIMLLGMLIMSCLLSCWAFLFSYKVNNDSANAASCTPLRWWAGALSIVLFLGFLCCAIFRFSDDKLTALNFHITVIDMLALPISGIVLVQVVAPQHITKIRVISNLLPSIILCPLCWWINQYWYTYTIAIVMVGYILAMMVYIMIVGSRYEHHLKEEYSSLQGRSVKWLINVIIFMALIVLEFALFSTQRSIWDQLIYYAISVVAWNLVFIRLWNTVLQRENSHVKEMDIDEWKQEQAQEQEEQNQSKQSLLSEDTVLFTQRLNELCEQEHIYCQDDLTRDELARRIGMSHTTFSRLLKETTGQNFYEYINNLRIEKATQLIREGKMDIGSIGQSVGYRYRSTFYRAFAAVHGCTPSEFAEQKR